MPIKKVLLCDAAFSALPILRALKARGYHVGVCGSRPEDPGHRLADASFVFNYSDVEQLAAVFHEHDYEAIIPGCTDVSYGACWQVAQRFSLPGFDNAEGLQIFQNKSAYRENCRTHRLPIPAFTHARDMLHALKFPILVKPTESFSGRGIIKAINIHDVPEVSNADCLYEEFVEGKLYSHSAFIRDQKIVLDFFVNEYCTVYPYQVNSSHLSTQLDMAMQARLRAALETSARVNGLCDGLVHTQFIANDDQFWWIEATRRCPGDLYSLLIARATGVDYADCYIAGFCGLTLAPPARPYNIQPISRHTLSVVEDCVFLNAHLEGSFVQADYVPLKKAGEPLKAAPNDRAGIYFIHHDSLAAMESVTPNLVAHAAVESL